MSDPIPIERLQPCLLDRLTDDDPGNPHESRNQRVISAQKYRKGVIRDLEWLFNASAQFFTSSVASPSAVSNYPEVARSVLNFGTRQMAGLICPNLEKLREELTQALSTFEPRLLPRSVQLTTSRDRNVVTFEIHGDLWATPVPEHLFIRTQVDLETGQSALGDGGHG